MKKNIWWDRPFPWDPKDYHTVVFTEQRINHFYFSPFFIIQIIGKYSRKRPICYSDFWCLFLSLALCLFAVTFICMIPFSIGNRNCCSYFICEIHLIYAENIFFHSFCNVFSFVLRVLAFLCMYSILFLPYL